FTARIAPCDEQPSVRIRVVELVSLCIPGNTGKCLKTVGPGQPDGKLPGKFLIHLHGKRLPRFPRCGVENNDAMRTFDCDQLLVRTEREVKDPAAQLKLPSGRRQDLL